MRALGFAIGFAGVLVLALKRRRDAERASYVSGDEFHAGEGAIYDMPIDGPAIVKRAEHMARVAYTPAHPNAKREGPEAGQGTTYVRWVFSEEPGTAEGLIRSGIAFVHDTVLPPGSSVGLHGHYAEEIYYILEGVCTMRLYKGDREIEIRLRAGDAQLTRPGETHCVLNDGTQDLRFVVVGATPRR